MGSIITSAFLKSRFFLVERAVEGQHWKPRLGVKGAILVQFIKRSDLLRLFSPQARTGLPSFRMATVCRRRRTDAVLFRHLSALDRRLYPPVGL